MNLIRYTISGLFFSFYLLLTTSSWAQPGTNLKIEKPEEYKKRVLASEKSDTKRFPFFKRFTQNTVTRYNYYFNANNKLNDIIERAKKNHRDDFSQLLPFYNFDISKMASDSIELDSVILKAQSAIALHDLRSDWVDNMYLLWGAAYHYQQKFDSSAQIFQYMNVAFAERQKNGAYKTIGSRRDGGGDFSISTVEKGGFFQKTLGKAPSRNETFLWQIKNYIEMNRMAEAASMIITLQNDAQFPKRLNSGLAEMQAYYFYKQNRWDSAAHYLELALPNASSTNEKARWEYLTAQLYELSGNADAAEKYFGKASVHTTDLVMDIYARLYQVKVKRDDSDDALIKNIEQLRKMAKRDKYEEYRDIIYYMAAQMQLERKDIPSALLLLKQSTQYSTNDPMHRNKAFLQIAQLSYEQKNYRDAASFYDSVRLDGDEMNKIQPLKASLKKIVANLDILDRQDSLQRLASMPEDQRKAYVKKLVKELRKKQGLKDETPIIAGAPTAEETSLFSNNNNKGEWYFYNSSSKSKGTAQFASKWGNRPNVDNWRRKAALQSINTMARGREATNIPQSVVIPETELTFDVLYNRIPLTEEAITSSNDSIQLALFELGKTYIQELEECSEGVTKLEELREKNGKYSKMDEVLFNLYYCYNKSGQIEKATAVKNLMNSQFKNSSYTSIVSTGIDPTKPSTKEVDKAYENIYDLFIEGKFEEAKAEKQKADARYKGSNWNPQLSYIEAVYYLKQNQDSIAIHRLQQLVNANRQDSNWVKRANTMIDVIKNRSTIEAELRALEIERPAEDEIKAPVVDWFVSQQQTKVNDKGTDSVKTKPTPTAPIVNNPVVVTPTPNTTKPAAYTFDPLQKHYVVLVLNKVDRVYVNEVKNAFNRHNRSSHSSRQLVADLIDIDADDKCLLISPFNNASEAVQYIDATEPITASRIIPWLKSGKYYYSIISEANLALLKDLKNVTDYHEFLKKNVPDKFK